VARLLLLQCELEHRHQAPHVAMALFAADLRGAGHAVRCVLVHPSALDELDLDADLILLDSIFPFGLIARLRGRTDAPLLVGGHNALQHVLRGPATAALVGPARRTVPAAVAALLGGDRAAVPGLWWREGGVVDCGPPAPRRSPADEVLPFEPLHDWAYLGPPRAPGSNLRVPSIVAAMGCVWNRSTAAEPFYAGVRARLPDLAMSDRARATLRSEFVDREGGCTFCTFRYTPPARHRAERGLALLLEQARAWVERGARGLSLQTEDPFPWLDGLLAGLEAEGLAGRIQELHARTIPWLLLRHADGLRATLATCRRLGIHLVLGQIGFEAFDERSLAVYHKGISAADNRRAARTLAGIEAEHPVAFSGTRGHGLIPLHPWTRPEDLLENLAALRADAPWLLPSLRPDRRLELYNEWTPLFWKAQDEGLLEPAPGRFGWDWRFADERTGEIVAVWGALLAEAREPRPGLSGELLSTLVRLREVEADPAARRRRYLELREGLRGRS
jgi:hypothetical protein